MNSVVYKIGAHGEIVKIVRKLLKLMNPGNYLEFS